MAVPRPRKKTKNTEPELSDRHLSTLQSVKYSGPPEYPVESVRKYIQRYNLPCRLPMTTQGYLTHGNVGRHSVTSKKKTRSEYYSALQSVYTHLTNTNIKEGDTIAEFLYSLDHKTEEFKLPFGEKVATIEPNPVVDLNMGTNMGPTSDSQKDLNEIYSNQSIPETKVVA